MCGHVPHIGRRELGEAMRRMAVLATVVLLALAAMAVPAQAAIHEIVASHCSGGHGNVDPGGLARPGPSIVKPLLATGVYDAVLTDRPGNEVDLSGTGFTNDSGLFTVWFMAGDGINGPQSKVQWDPSDGYFQFIIPGEAQLIIPAAQFDHVAFEHCANFHHPE